METGLRKKQAHAMALAVAHGFARHHCFILVVRTTLATTPASIILNPQPSNPLTPDPTLQRSRRNTLLRNSRNTDGLVP